MRLSEKPVEQHDGEGLRYVECVTKQRSETSGPIIYGLVLSAPAHAVMFLAMPLARHRKRIGIHRDWTRVTKTMSHLDLR